MALKFWTGAVRSDKSNKLYEYVLEEAKGNPNMDYLIVVPEQFTLMTQRQLVTKSENHGILNVDVLSFMRLAHRISDEVGAFDTSVTTLDEMGKNLILQHIANTYKDELTVFGDSIHKLGVIGEIKSIISEFMQYNVQPDKVYELAEVSRKHGKGMLSKKLSDIHFLYSKFLEFTKDRYTTVEETLAKTTSIIHMSDTIKKSVIVFDGFTGFTPIQLGVIEKLLEYSCDVHVALLGENSTDEKNNSNNVIKEHDLFYLSKVTIHRLTRMAEEIGIPIAEPYVADKQDKEPTLHMFVAASPDEEMGMVAARVRKLLEEGLRYKDIAIVTGDIEGYRYQATRVFEKSNIPYFVDKTQPILLNPFIEYIRALLSIYEDNYSYESMFRYLKSGLTEYSDKEISLIDNYCVATGVKGYKSWHARFIKTTQIIDEDTLLAIEELRGRIISDLDKFGLYICDDFSNTTKATVRDFATALYNCIINANIENKLKKMAEDFANDGEISLSEEYKQVYPRIMDILDEIVDLIADEIVSVKEFGEILSAALDGLRIGIAPRTQDYVQIGDLTRSRIGDVKALFIVGVNEGIIPKSAAGGGIINEADKEFLLDSDNELALSPTAREDAYTQRLYLYMALGKPEHDLYVSYARLTNDGKTQMPSYLIKKLKSEHKEVEIERLSSDVLSRVMYEEEAFSELAGMLGKVRNKTLISDISDVKALLEYFLHNEKYGSKTIRLVTYALVDSISTYNDSIGKAVANAIYGKNIVGSVTRLEVYANCAYQYFLKYGLKLKEREIFNFEAKDMGAIFHDSLAQYASLLEKSGNDWRNINESEIDRLMNEAVEISVAKNQMAALYAAARTSYMVNRIKRIMGRTAKVLTAQVQKGEFTPRYFEIGFEEMSDLSSLNIRLSDDEYMRLLGRIDRVDTYEKENEVYVKIIDYKSSNKKLDFAAIYEGRQLQLLVYLNAVSENLIKQGKNVIPAGILYYHIDDPVISEKESLQEEDIKLEIAKKLKLSGLINGDNNGKIAEMMDSSLDSSSTVISARKLKSGEIKSNDFISEHDFDVLSSYVNAKIESIGRQILDGNVGVVHSDASMQHTETDCEYCTYKGMCMKNYNPTELDSDDSSDNSADDNTMSVGKLTKEEWIARMEMELKK